MVKNYAVALLLIGMASLVSSCGSGGGGGSDTNNPVSYTVGTSAGANGSISPASRSVNSGSTTSFTITPDAGYVIDSVTGCGGSLSGNTYTTGAIGGGCTVSATFAAATYTVGASAGANGSISPASASVTHGSTTSFTVTPDAEYVIDSVTGCGGSLVGNTYTTGPITGDCTVSASFTLIMYSVSTNAGTNGSIAPGGATVTSGSTASFTVTPDVGYVIDSVTGCGGSLVGDTYTTGPVFANCTVSASFAPETFTVSANAGPNGSIAPGGATVTSGSTASFTVTPDVGYVIDSVTGCGGALVGNTYTTGPVVGDCTVSATFALATFTVSATAGPNGAIAPASATVSYGSTASFTVTPDPDYVIVSVSGCGGSLAGDTYTTGPITSNCTVSASFGFSNPPAAAAEATLTIDAVKIFRFTWTDVSDAAFYRLLENPDGSSGYTQVGPDVPSGTEVINHIVPLYARFNASYILQSCNNAGCVDAAAVGPSGTLENAVGYFKASNTDLEDEFGGAISLSADGRTLVVGAYREDSAATGVNGDDTDNSVGQTGAAYVFVRDDDGVWTQQAYLKASNTELGDSFGYSVSLSDNGNTLAVGALFEGSNATGVNGDQTNNSAGGSGAVYVFSRTGQDWAQSAYIKASNTERDDFFGSSVALSGDGSTLAVAAEREDSAATGINGNEADNSAAQSGAVYVFGLDAGSWSQQAYVKPASTDAGDEFGWRYIALSTSGDTLAVGARGDSSGSTGIGGDPSDNSVAASGAVYVFTRDAGIWSQEAYIKASNAEFADRFGMAVDLSGSGDTLVVGAAGEASAAASINGDETDNSAPGAGAAYVFQRTNGVWAQEAYLKSANMDPDDLFGGAVAISDDGSTIAVGVVGEDSNSIGINGLRNNSSEHTTSGAIYIFVRIGGTWLESAFVKPSTIKQGEFFGFRVSLSGDGGTLAAGVPREDSSATGVGGDQSDDSLSDAGAVFTF